MDMMGCVVVLLTIALEALTKGSFIEQSEEVAFLKGSGAHHQHVGGHHVGQPLNPTYITNLSKISPHTRRTLCRINGRICVHISLWCAYIYNLLRYDMYIHIHQTDLSHG